MPNRIKKLIERADEVIEKIESFPFKFKGFDEIYEWVEEIEEMLEVVDSVYDQVAEGIGLLEAWENEGASGQEFFDDSNEMSIPELFFLEGYDQDDDPLLIDFLEKADEYIRGLIEALDMALGDIAEIVFHDYDMSVNLQDELS